MAQAKPSLALPDQRERARALAYLYLSGAALALASTVLLPTPAGIDEPATLGVIAAAVVIGTCVFVFASSISGRLLVVGVAAGTALVSCDIYFGGPRGVNNETFYLFVSCYSFYFLPRRVALAEMALVGCGYAAALAALSEPDIVNKWVVTMGTMLVAGMMIARLVSALERSLERSSAHEEGLRRAEERFRSSFDNAAIGMAIVDLDGSWLRVNGALAKLTGYPSERLIGMSFRDLTPPEDLKEDFPALRALVSGERDVYQAEKRYIRADGELVWISLSVSAVRDRDNRTLHLISQMQDITARKSAEHELAERALHDPLTGLPNRLLFGDRVQVALKRIERGGAPVAVFFIDLDRFKLVNDSLGHAIGDRMLIEIARRLLLVVRPADTVSRFGGDEFTILCEHTDEHTARTVGDRVLGALSEPVVVDGHELFVSASIGIAVSRDRHTNADAMLRDADSAMYLAKDGGGSRLALYERGLRVRATERLELENDLRRAIERGQLRLKYQPHVDFATAQVVGVEALVRWQHPQRGLMLPGRFIDVAEDSGLIIQLGEWVMSEAFRQARRWQDAGLRMTVSVNVSPRQLVEPRFPASLQAAIAESGADPHRLCLEVTESTAVQVGDSTLAALKSSGIRLALDDFGAGFSSLHQIRRLPPVDTLKIDRSYVEELGRHPSDVAIIAAIVGMATALEFEVVAEGVQNAEQVHVLHELGCHRGQGYYFGRPMDADQVQQIVRKRATGELLSA